MKTVLITLRFGEIVHSIRHQVADAEWADPQFRTELKNRLESKPQVLRMQESADRDYKAELKEMTAERDRWKKLCGDLSKKLNQAAIDEKPCFGVFHPQKG